MPQIPQQVTTQQLKADIDAGKTGDKIDQGFDLGLSSLGTDDEAAGTPYTPEQIQMARALERGGAALQPAEQGQRNPKAGFPAVWAVVVALAAVLAALAFAVWGR